MPIEEMNLEEFETYYPQIANNTLETPMMWPQIAKYQDPPEEVQFWQKRGVFYNKGDRYHPKPE